MVIRARENVAGAWAFLAGIVLAILVGIFPNVSSSTYVIWLLFVLGLVIGYFVAEKNVRTFLIAAISVVLVSYVALSAITLSSAISGVWIATKQLSPIFASLLNLFVPATIVVALKSVFSISTIGSKD